MLLLHPVSDIWIDGILSRIESFARKLIFLCLQNMIVGAT